MVHKKLVDFIDTVKQRATENELEEAELGDIPDEFLGVFSAFI